MIGVVDGSEHVGIHVVHGVALQNRVGKTFRNFTPTAHLASPLLKNSVRRPRRLGGTVFDIWRLRGKGASVTEQGLSAAPLCGFPARWPDQPFPLKGQH